MKISAIIRGKYTGVGTYANPKRPRFMDKYAFTKLIDATNMPAAAVISGTTVVDVKVNIDSAIIPTIIADPEFGPGSVISQSPVVI